VELSEVIARIQAMLRAGRSGGCVRRCFHQPRPGCAGGGQVPQERLDAAFEYMVEPRSLQRAVVIRTTDTATAAPPDTAALDHAEGPQGFSMTRHCEFLVAADRRREFLLLPAKKLFTLAWATCGAAGWSRGVARRFRPTSRTSR